MLDLIFVAATALFFAVAILYVCGCESLRQDPFTDHPQSSKEKAHQEPHS